MSAMSNLVSRYRLLRHAAMAALVLPAALLAACAQEPPPPPAPVQAAPPAPAPAPVPVPRARG
jgi:hypothetical protein